MRAALRNFGMASAALAVLGAMSALHVRAADGGEAGWTTFNRTLSSERFVPLDQINTANVGRLKEVCRYDLDLDTSFQTGPLVIGAAMYGTSETDTFAIDAASCRPKWRVHEDAKLGLPVNRGVAYLDGRLFRGLQNGHVVAYDAATGKKLWDQTIADPKKGESVPAAPIAAS